MLPTPAAPSDPGLRSHARVCSAEPRGSDAFGLAPRSISIDARSKYALTTAMLRALVPSAAVSLTLAPWSSSTSTASGWSLRTANSSGVEPAFDFAFTSAPCAIRISAAGALPSDAAHISAVCPLYGSTALTLAPASSSSLTASGLPVSAAVIRAVWPSSDVPFGSAPALSSRSITPALPLVHASDSGVILYRVAAFTSAPAASSMSTRATSSRCDGPVKRGRAVGIRRVDVVAGAFCATSARTVAASPRFTASISFELAEAGDAARRSAETTRALRMCVI